MSFYKIKAGVAVIADGDSGWFVMDETERKTVTSGPAAALLGLISRDLGDEDTLVGVLEDRFSAEQVYYALIQLEKHGVIVSDSGEPGSPADLFRTKVYGQDQTGYPPSRGEIMTLRVLTVGEVDPFADALAASLARSDLLMVERVNDWHADEMSAGAFYLVVAPDYLEPELEEFGRFAREHGLRWLPVKPRGVIPSMGPLFVPGETGCVVCFLDRVKGHRRPEVKQIRENGGKQSLGLSMGRTIHSFEALAGLLAVELEKLAMGGVTEMLDGVFSLDFRTLGLARHSFMKRPQCPMCGTLLKGNARTGVPLKDPLRLQSRVKADYRDGGERICSAIETLEKFAHLISPITGVVGKLTTVEDIPSCFGHVARSDWNVRDGKEAAGDGHNWRFSAVGFSTGKGRSEPQARASALGEAVERYSSQYEGYEPCIRAAFRELGDAAIHPYDLMGFSDRQYAEREAWRKKGETAYVPDPYDDTRPIDWTPAWSLTARQWRLIPSAFAYYSYPREGGGDICSGCSNGVAAGNCLEEAIMQGFYELVERDATAMWWYHKLRKPAVDWHSFDSSFTAGVDETMEEMGMKLMVIDLTSDLGIPVFAANLFSGDEDLHFTSIGLGCHRNPLVALERAVSELGQFWKTKDMATDSLRFQDSPHSREPFLQADPRQAPKKPSDFATHERGDFLEDMDDMVRLLGDRGLEMLIMDLTRPDVGFPVARVIVPGMVHFWPRFGCRRLFGIPKAAGWIDKDAGEDDLNPVPFYL
jgi:oxazoline/thiazoline synthase